MQNVKDIFLVFLKLGLTSFGGPIAHLGYFRSEFVGRRAWLDEAAYAELVALAQFLPGPSSSQVGMSIGLLRGGVAGMFAAWFAFTMPSVFLLIGFAFVAQRLEGSLAEGITHGLMLVAVAVVAQAVMQMARVLTPDPPRVVIALATCVFLLAVPFTFAQIGVLIAGGLIGYRFFTPPPPSDHPVLAVPVSRKAGAALIALFFVLLALLPLFATQGGAMVQLIDGFYRAGALVFGGGHVVLPLLEAELIPKGLIDRETFFAGYGAAQAVPGPLFSFAAFVGFAGTGGGLVHAALCLIAMFGSSFLLVPGVLPFWARLARVQSMRAALMGLNAAVVGLLAAAFITPVFTSAILSIYDFAAACLAFALLIWSPLPVWLIVVMTGLTGLFLI
ncbi:MAG: chromate efflux transporter [Parvibaculum sp.]|nr:chromate efflux transporter [Parvibaculum sp.]